MPRYFFHVEDGDSEPDEEGTELADIHAARAQALRTSGEILRDNDGSVWNGTEWRMEVADEAGTALFTLRFTATEHSKRGNELRLVTG